MKVSFFLQAKQLTDNARIVWEIYFSEQRKNKTIKPDGGECPRRGEREFIFLCILLIHKGGERFMG